MSTLFHHPVPVQDGDGLGGEGAVKAKTPGYKKRVDSFIL